MTIPRTYIAGPYSHPARAVRIRNAWTAGALAAHVAEAGAYPVVPHLVGMHVAEHCDVQRPYEWWIEVTAAELLTCHAVFLVPGWEQSNGARGEQRLAIENGIPWFTDLAELKAWISSRIATGAPGSFATNDGYVYTFSCATANGLSMDMRTDKGLDTGARVYSLEELRVGWGNVGRAALAWWSEQTGRKTAKCPHCGACDSREEFGLP